MVGVVAGGVPPVVYVSACVSPQMLVDLGEDVGGFAGCVCAGMRGRLDVGGLALLPVVSGELRMSWRTQLARCRWAWAFCGDVPQVVCVVGYVPRDSYDLTWAGPAIRHRAMVPV